MARHQRSRDHAPAGQLTSSLPTRVALAAARLFIGTALAFLGLVAAWPLIGPRASLVRRSWNARVAVAGTSMEPALESGEWLLVDPDAYASRSPTVDDLVLTPDPREPARLLIKRVAQLGGDGSLELWGDAAASTDSLVFGSVPASSVRGRPWFRYWPLRRIGRIR